MAAATAELPRVLEVALFTAPGRTLDYAVPEELWPAVAVGSLVEVPLGTRSQPVPAVVLSRGIPRFAGKLKPLLRILRRAPVLNAEQRALLDWTMANFAVPRHTLLRMAVPRSLREPEKTPGKVSLHSKKNTPEAATTLLEGRFRDRLEISLAAIGDAAERGQVLLLCPGVRQARELLALAQEKLQLGTLWHEKLTQRQRRSVWEGLAMGEISLLVGTASALFLPFPRLGLVLVESEESSAYRIREPHPFHGRELALQLARIHAVPCLLCSTVPSLESMRRVRLDLCHHRRIAHSTPLPAATAVNLGTALSRGWLFSQTLERQLADCLDTGSQAILIHLRRDATYLRCGRCSFLSLCPACGTPLPLAGENFLCPRCLHSSPAGRACPSCGGPWQRKSVGLQRVEEVLRQLFPKIRCVRWDRDAKTDAALCALERDFAEKKWDVLLGPSLAPVALNSPHLALVALVDADLLLQNRNFRGGERALQGLGAILDRMPDRSRLLLQTRHPRDPILGYLCKENRSQFHGKELESRRDLDYPPFRTLLRQEWSASDGGELQSLGKRWVQFLHVACQAIGRTEVRGPVVPSPSRRRDQFLVESWILTPQLAEVIAALPGWKKNFGPLPSKLGERLIVDI